MNSGDLIFRNYGNFRGVDFSSKEVDLSRSPDSLNMWKNYRTLAKGLETRPDLELMQSYDNTIYGIHFYTVNNVEHMIIHAGTKLIDRVGTTETVLKASGMNVIKSQSFVYNNILYIKDGINYLMYDGTTLSNAQDSAYIPTTSISRKPEGGGTIYEDVNLLTGMRINTFCADGEATEYQLDVESFDSNYAPIVKVNGVAKTVTTDYTFSYATGKITFVTAPPKPDTDGQDNVSIQFRKTVPGYLDRILKCTLLCVFDNRVFFSGNQDYPNAIFHSSLDNPRYISDLDYYSEGLDLARVKALVPGNNALWVFKEPSQANTTVFYHTPTIDAEYGKIYPSTHSSISTGCVSTGINFNDDIVFYSSRGLEGITGDVTTEQVISHKSSFVDAKLLSETNYSDLILAEWEGYLLTFVGNKVYLADSRQKYANVNHYEYEWYYWQISKTPTCVEVKNDVLYIGTSDGIYTLTNTSSTRTVDSYWCTPDDEFKYPNMMKTTNKRGCVIDMDGASVTLSVKTNNGTFENINTYANTQGFVVARIKKKKWKSIQLKFSSSLPFKLYSCTLESYIGSYVKRA